MRPRSVGVGGRFVGRRFAAKGGVDFGFDTETSTGRSYRQTSTPTRELDLAVSDRRAAVEARA